MAMRWNPEEEAPFCFPSFIFQGTLFKDYQSYVTIHRYPHTHLAQTWHSSACRHSSLGDVAISGIKLYILFIQPPTLSYLSPRVPQCAEADFNSPYILASILPQTFIVYIVPPLWFTKVKITCQYLKANGRNWTADMYFIKLYYLAVINNQLIV